MARLTIAKTDFLQRNLGGFKCVACVEARAGQAPKNLVDYDMSNVSNILSSITHMRALGGKESVTINSRPNGSDCLIIINVHSVSPDKKTWSEWVIFLSCDVDMHYKLLNV